MTVHHLPSSAGAEPHKGEKSALAKFMEACAEREARPEPEPAPEEERIRAQEAAHEEKVLAEAAAVGLREAEWMRTLPLPDGAWIRGPLADAVEEAMSGLDPEDHDDPDRYGHGGVSESARTRLDGLVYDVAETSTLTAAQRVALFAVVHCVRGIPQTLANDPWVVVQRGDLSALCGIIGRAIASPA
ncbi:hypothetical protein [Streptomyces gardneri]|uniref:hypothetical protein n=1 Tax=Streptomyces gardneri TaxID=66892 RepID=UPI0035DF5FF9